MSRLTRSWFYLLFFLLFGAAVVLYYRFANNRDALWNIISQQCLPHQAQGKGTKPCLLVDEKQGIVVLKDRNGPLQYLLMPSIRVSGIEDPLLLARDTPNYFEQAWQARHFISDKYGARVSDGDISLAVNSQYGRTQDQLHIHISCLLPIVKNKLFSQRDNFSTEWQSLPGGLLGHNYLVKRVTAAELHKEGAFRLLASGVPDAKQKMGHYGLAMTTLANGDFLLLATERQLLTSNLASAEELQDHQCKVFPLPPQ